MELLFSQSKGKMTLAVQTEDGRRAMGEFDLNCNLNEIMEELQRQGKLKLPETSFSVVPVMILATNAEIRGKEELTGTSLAGLGFAAGKRELIKLKFIDTEKEKKVSSGGNNVRRVSSNEGRLEGDRRERGDGRLGRLRLPGPEGGFTSEAGHEDRRGRINAGEARGKEVRA